jgi:hypothetical protein
MSGYEMDVITGGWETLHNGELYMFSSPNTIRMRERHVVRMV